MDKIEEVIEFIDAERAKMEQFAPNGMEILNETINYFLHLYLVTRDGAE